MSRQSKREIREPERDPARTCNEQRISKYISALTLWFPDSEPAGLNYRVFSAQLPFELIVENLLPEPETIARFKQT